MADKKPQRINKSGIIKGLTDKEYNAEYFKKNKETLYQNRKNKKWFCDYCNRTYTYECKYLHLQTKKHLIMKELHNLKNQEKGM